VIRVNNKVLKTDVSEKRPGVENTSDEQFLQMPFVKHLTDLRRVLVRSIICVVVLMLASYPFAREIYAFLSAPLAEAFGAGGGRLIFTNLPEVFLTYIKLSFFSGFMLSFPFIAFQLWSFISPGLYKDERLFFMGLLFATPVLFFTGAAFVYYFVLPLAWDFFLSFEVPSMQEGLSMELEAKVNEYLGLTMKLLFAFGFAFELPLIMVLLNRAGFVSRQKFAKARRYALVVIFACAAVLTPPDVISQIALAIPMLLLYEVSLLFMKKSD